MDEVRKRDQEGLKRQLIEDARNNFIADNLAVLCANRHLKELSLWSERLKAIDKQEQPQVTPEMIKQHWRNKKGR